MSTETKERVDTGGLAFPIGDNSAGPVQPGMTLRDYLAAKAMEAWIVALAARRNEPGYTDKGAALEAAELGYFTADSLIAHKRRTEQH